MIEAALILLVSSATLWLSLQQSRLRLKGWEKAVASCGLQIEEGPTGWQPQVRARAGPMRVRIEPRGKFIWIVVEAPPPPDFHSVTIRPQSELEVAREIEIGDRRFDDAFFIVGPTRLVFALLDAETRRLLLQAKEKSGVVIAAGELRAGVHDAEKIAGVLPLLLDIRKRFLPPVNVLHRMVANATEDPEPGVRLQNLLLLIRELSWSPETDGALRKACSDPVPEIRLRAAKQLGAEARGVLLDLAENLEDDAVSAEALSILDRELPFERLNAILGLALRRRRLQTALFCMAAIGRRGAAAGVDLLAKVLEREHGELAPAAAQALGAIGSPAAEPSLIEALQREDADLRVAAANALGRAGSASAVPALKEAAERSRLDLDLRRATRQAIAEIRSRAHGASPGQLSLTGAEAGQLSLAQTEAGELSLAQGETGELSLADDPAGQLSLPPGEPPA
jgi:hypothetical protein